MSPRAIESKYCRTTLPARRAKSLSASTIGTFAVETAVGGAAGAAIGAAVGSAAGALAAGVTGALAGAAVRVAAVAIATAADAEGPAAGVCLDGAGACDAPAALGTAAGAEAAAEGRAVTVRGCGVALGASLGTADGAGAWVNGASVGAACGVDVESATRPDSEPRLPTTESPAPMTKPRTTTPMITGTNGKVAPCFGGDRRERRRGFSCICRRISREEDTMLSAKRRRVVRVPIPIDVATIAETASCAFALATPMRVDRLLELAVGEALGLRAPPDKRERGVRATLLGFAAGKFIVDVDGRIFDRPDAVIVCSGVATLRFYSTEPQRNRAPAL